MRHIVSVLAVCAVSLCGIRSVDASWLYTPLERLVEKSPLVVAGKIKSIDAAGRWFKGSHPYEDIASIRIAEVLKNEDNDPTVTVGGIVFMTMPSVNNLESNAQSLRHKKGTEGIWILTAGGSSYAFTYPRNLQPLEKRAEIAAIIARQKAEQLEALPRVTDEIKRRNAELAAAPLYTAENLQADLNKEPDASVDVNSLIGSRVGGKDGGYVFLDRSGKVQLVTRYFVQGGFSDGLAPVGTGIGKHSAIINYGYIDRTGKLAIPAVYDQVHPFYNGLAVVRKDRYGIINKEGQFVVVPQYGYRAVFQLYESATQVGEGEAKSSVHRKGSVPNSGSPEGREGSFSEGLQITRSTDGSIVVRDVSGNTVFELNEKLLGFGCGALRPLHDDFAALEAGFEQGPKWGFISKAGELVIAPTFSQVGDFSEGLVPIALSNDMEDIERRWGYADTTGKVVIKPAFVSVASFSEGLAAVEVLTWIVNPRVSTRRIIRDRKCGFIDHTGTLVIPPWFDEAQSFTDGLAQVREGAFHGFIDRTGKYVWRAPN